MNIEQSKLFQVIAPKDQEFRLHRRHFIGVFLGAISGGLTGCSGVRNPLDPAIAGPFHKPANYFLASPKLPAGVRRVAMLPLTSPQNDVSAKSGIDALQPILYGELTKARLFEVLLISNDKLEEWTGKPAWDRDDVLPADFLVKIKEQTGCDAILFSQLSYYRPYPPLAVGWRLLLVKAEGGEVIWSVDEIFDAGEPRVMNSARRYEMENERVNSEVSKHVTTQYGAAFPSRVPGLEGINSPRHFAKYAASAAIQTLTVK
jgi:hypothetical protein